MDFQQTVALIELLRASGVKRFKSLEHEIDFSDNSDDFKVQKVKPLPSPAPNAAVAPIEQKAIDEANAKIKDMLATLNMTPQQMADKMYPEAAL